MIFISNHTLFILSLFHLKNGPNTIITTAGIIIGTNTASKYGAPTDILPNPNESNNNGYNVPKNTVRVAATNNILFINKLPSLDSIEKLLLFSIERALHAYKPNEPPITIIKNIKINNPLSGSDANE
jgi:hypothetical protein